MSNFGGLPHQSIITVPFRPTAEATIYTLASGNPPVTGSLPTDSNPQIPYTMAPKTVAVIVLQRG